MKVTKHRATVMMGGATLTHDFASKPEVDDVLKALGLHGLKMKSPPNISFSEVETEVELTPGQALDAWLKENGLVVARPEEGEDGVTHLRISGAAGLFDAYWAKVSGK